MHDNNLPILYTFRRCPYAMRARLAITISQQPVEYREITLRDKPSELFEASPKGTVPVLVLPDGQVIDESLDIMFWALQQNDPENWLAGSTHLIQENDNTFKHWLDHYKYADRFPEHDALFYRQQGEAFLSQLETLLQQASGLSADHLTLTDYAIAPFVRQFAHVDRDWFYNSHNNSHYKNLIVWLNNILHSELFTSIMVKYEIWRAGAKPSSTD